MVYTQELTPAASSAKSADQMMTVMWNELTKKTAGRFLVTNVKSHMLTTTENGIHNTVIIQPATKAPG